jgi:hypothetical protein
MPRHRVRGRVARGGRPRRRTRRSELPRAAPDVAPEPSQWLYAMHRRRYRVAGRRASQLRTRQPYAGGVAGQDSPAARITHVVRRVAWCWNHLPAEDRTCCDPHVRLRHRRELAPECVERLAEEPSRRPLKPLGRRPRRGSDRRRDWDISLRLTRCDPALARRRSSSSAAALRLSLLIGMSSGATRLINLSPKPVPRLLRSAVAVPAAVRFADVLTSPALPDDH